MLREEERSAVSRGKIPVGRILEKTDALCGKRAYGDVGRLLVYWRDEAVSLGDARGELAIVNELVGHYRKQNDREKGLGSVDRALFLVKKLGQEDMASGATVLINCATAYKAFGMPREALPLYFRAEQVYKKELTETDPRLGGLYNNMALALADLACFEAAEDAYMSALHVMERITGGEAEAAITYVNLAHLYEAAGRADRIGECLGRAFRLLQSENLVHDGAFAFVLEKCAPSFGYFGDTAAYEALQKEAKAIYERT